jgi:recombination protein RecR
MENPDILKQFLKILQQVPYLASKNLFRVTSHFLEMDSDRAKFFCEILLKMKELLVKCSTCFVWKERDKNCLYCNNRDKSVICVVETWQDLLAMERSVEFKGAYHILGGSISPLDGISPEDLNIKSLIERIKSTNVNELILALNQTPEGEVTSVYIAKKINECVNEKQVDGLNRRVQITCLARGIPIGSSLEYLDKLTLNKALSERRPF